MTDRHTTAEATRSAGGQAHPGIAGPTATAATAATRKLGLKENYALLTRDLGWEPDYERPEDVFRTARFEGIVIHDWNAWEDPFRLTMDAYWKYQGEKERKLYAILDAFQQNGAHLNVSDARYVQALKLFINGVIGMEYASHRGFCIIGREFPGTAARIAAQMQAIDELRHAQTQTHALSHYAKYFAGMSNFPEQYDRTWYLSIPKSFFEDAVASGPFEFVVGICFAFEYVLTNLVFMPWMSGAAYNGDMSTVSFGFSAQSDEARHMTLGIEVIKFLLEQDPANVPIVQGWIDKWFWRGYRLLSLVAAMMDYMLPKRVMSWAEAWSIYYEQNGGALFADLARYGIRPPKYAEQTVEEKQHVSHQLWSTFYQFRHAAGFAVWLPSAEEQDWLSAKYPETFDRYYRPRYAHWAAEAAAGRPFANATLPMLCQVCQWPLLFTEPGDPTRISHRAETYLGERFHCCSDGCRDIFRAEPEKYVHAHLPVHQIYQGHYFKPDVDPTAPGFNPLVEALRYMGITAGLDGGDFTGHVDALNWQAWSGRSASLHDPMQPMPAAAVDAGTAQA
ncbi:YHS domain-containing protein [Pseudaquabacterium rugosum]|uniref:YHS domain-containing protein n=1 Tax=Pseudaquabacterium rugosum TaxID=2984194 RepID=A0ABU9BHR2_9BURK